MKLYVALFLFVLFCMSVGVSISQWGAKVDAKTLRVFSCWVVSKEPPVWACGYRANQNWGPSLYVTTKDYRIGIND